MARKNSANSRAIRLCGLKGTCKCADAYNMDHYGFKFPALAEPSAPLKSGKFRKIRSFRLGVVIPCRGDADLLRPCLASLCGELGDDDRVVVANSMGDRFTAAISREFNVDCLTPPSPARGMAIASAVREIMGDDRPNRPALLDQFNQSAAAGPDLLLIAHADMVFPPGWRGRLESALAANSELCWGAFGHLIADGRCRFRLLEAGNTWRAAFWQIPFGDQAMFLRASALPAIGGFPVQEKYEDLELALRLKAIGPPLILDYPVTTGARHWRSGSSLQTIRNWCILAGYRAGWLKPDQIMPCSAPMHDLPVLKDCQA